jgi:hypothetical protein
VTCPTRVAERRLDQTFGSVATGPPSPGRRLRPLMERKRADCLPGDTFYAKIRRIALVGLSEPCQGKTYRRRAWRTTSGKKLKRLRSGW